MCKSSQSCKLLGRTVCHAEAREIKVRHYKRAGCHCSPKSSAVALACLAPALLGRKRDWFCRQIFYNSCEEHALTLTQCIAAVPWCGWWTCHAVCHSGSSAAEHACPGEHSPFNASAMLLHGACSHVPLCCAGQPIPASSAGVPPGQLLPPSSAGVPPGQPGLPHNPALMTHLIAHLPSDMESSLGPAAPPATDSVKRSNLAACCCVLEREGKSRKLLRRAYWVGHTPANGTCLENLPQACMPRGSQSTTTVKDPILL